MPEPKKLILKCDLSPGDILTMTAAVESLHAAYPGEYLTDVRTCVPDIWEHNPRITPIADDDPSATLVPMYYPQINFSNQRPINFLGCYTEFLATFLQRPIPLITNRPHIYLTAEERGWQTMPQEHFHGGKKVPYCLVNAGAKSDFTTKQPYLPALQEVIDSTQGWFQWVQIGSNEHNHPRLRHVIDLVGKTDHRMLHRLVYHAVAGVGPVTYLLHLFAAFERPYVYLAGGREPVTWINYPRMTTLHTMGALSCCHQPCWRSRVVKLSDGAEQDDCLCEQPIVGEGMPPTARCMAMIKAQTIINILEMHR